MAFPFKSEGLFGSLARRIPRHITARRRWTPLHWFWRADARAARARASRGRLGFTPLEPRLLLNADVLAVNLTQHIGAPPVDHSLLVQLMQETDKVNNQTVTIQRVQIVDQNNGNAVLAFGDLSEISAISITDSGAGKDKLTVDATSFAGQSAPNISFQGGSGQNSVVFDNTTATQWTLTGANAGTVSGGGVNLAFQNAANLTGAANNADTLTVKQGGTLSGVFDGGAGGTNALNFDNGPHSAAAYSTGPINNVITLDGHALNYAEVQSVNIGDPQSVTLDPNVTGTLSWNAGQNEFELDSSGGSQLFAPTQGQDFDLVLGAGDVLTVDTINFDTIDPGHAFNISGNGSSIEFQGDITASAGFSATVNASDTQSISNSFGTESLTSPTVGGSITLDSGYTIKANTISLSANSTSTETISNTDALADIVTTAAIKTTNLAQITIDGTLNASGAVSVISTVTVNDSIDNVHSDLLHAVSVTATDTAAVTFGSMSSVTAATLDAEANTSVIATINADHIGTGVLPGFVPASLLGIAVQVSENITNSTTVTVASGATIGVGAGSATQPAAYLAASDVTDAMTTVTLDDPVSLPVVGNVLVFSALDSADTLSRVTSVDVGNLAATAAPASGAANTLDSNGGDIALSARSGGTVSNTETSTGLGTVEINAGGATGDSTSVEVAGVNVSANGLSLTALANTSYSESGHLATLTVGGATDATLAYAGVTAGADGLVVSTEDDLSLSASSVAPNFDPATAMETGGTAGSGLQIAVNRTTSVISFNKDVIALVTGSTVTSSGVVRVQAVDNTSLSSDAVMAADSASSTGASVSGGGTLAANIVNGAISASIENSTVSTTGGTSDVQVLAGDSSTITSRAETSASATGTSTAVGIAGTISLNAIGWTIGTTDGGLLGATVGTLLGTNSFWTDNAPTDPTASGNSANVTAKITNSILTAGGALLVQAIASGVVNSTVTNVSQATATASGNGVAVAVGGVAASNRVSRAATAFLNNVMPFTPGVLAGGAITVNAQNNASITSTSSLVTSAVATTADAKTTYVSTDQAGNAGDSNTKLQPTTTLKFGDTVLFKATYTTNNLFGTDVPKMETINPGDTVVVGPTYPSARGVAGQVYVYLGTTPETIDLEEEDFTVTTNWRPVSVVNGAVYKFMGPGDTNVVLGTGDLLDSSGNAITTITADYYDLGYWYKVPKAELTPSTDDEGISTGGSASGAAVGGIVVLNEVHGGAYAIVEDFDGRRRFAGRDRGG